MQKIKLYIASVVAIVSLLVMAPVASAAVLQLSPANINVVAGQNFTVNVALDPQGLKNYTLKMQLDFPANMLTVNSFTFASGWAQIATAGYDAVDNTNGLLVKTAGFPGGTMTLTNFGTASFTAKNTGTVNITADASSFALNASGQNVLVNTGAQTSVLVNPVPAVLGTSTTSTTTTNNSVSSLAPDNDAGQTTIQTLDSGEVLTGEPVGNEANTTQTNPASANLLGAAKNVLSLGTGNTWLAILVMLIIIGGVWYGIDRYSKTKNRQSPQQPKQS